MRDAVLARIRATQSATPRIPSPYAGFFMSLTFQRMSAFVALIAVAVGGMGGVSFAAEDALPGDAMYAVKVHVNEELRSLAAITPAAKAAVATSRVERRLMEAEVLAARGELNEVAAADLSTRFSASAEEASSHIDTLTEKNLDDAATASTEFESVLAAHGRILDNIIVARNGETEEALATLRVEIAERREATERKREEFRIAMLSGEEGRKTSARFYETVTRDAEDAVRELEERSGTAIASDALAIELLRRLDIP